MKRWWPKRMWSAIAVRMIADALVFNMALALAQVIMYVWQVGVVGATITQREALAFYVIAYFTRFWLLTALGLIIFYISGCYTHGRMYRGRYKVLVVAQAVSLSYLLFGFLVSFFFQDNILVGRGVLVVSYLLTMLLTIGSRMWVKLWMAIASQDEPVKPAPPKDEGIKTVLVIGGAGYIGSAVTTRLLQKGYRVRLLDLLAFGKQPIAPLLGNPNLTVIRADFLQVTKVVEAMQRVDAVIHLGAIVGDPACAMDDELTIGVNITATRMIAEVAKGNRVDRFIFASTCSVYGASDELLDERSALNPVSLYASSKIASEQVLRKLADERFAPVILRFGTIYGLSGRIRFDLVVNLLAAKAVTEGKITIFGGDQWRPFVHVDDAARAVVAALEAPLRIVRNQTFNVGSNEQNYTIQQAGEIVHQCVPTAEIVNMGSDIDRRNYRVSFDKIRNVLGYTAQWTIEQGVQQVIDAIRTGLVRDYRLPQYSNVKYLRLHRVVQDAFNSKSSVVDFLGDEDSSRLIQHSDSEVAVLYDKAVEGWARMLEQRKNEPEGRTLYLTDLTLRVGRAMGLNEAALKQMRRGVLLHDFGLLGIPTEILQKPGPLTGDEWELMRRHTQYSYEMLSAFPSLRPALDIPYGHHERWDGSGYPRGLRGAEIPLAARIFAVVDVWAALGSNRPHRPAWPAAQVIQYLQEQAGQHFDPEVARVFLSIIQPAAAAEEPASPGLVSLALLAEPLVAQR